MFGLSTKEVLAKAIVHACYNCRNTLKRALMDNTENLDNAEDEESVDKILVAARREYLDEVLCTVIDTFRLSSPVIHEKLLLSLRCPSMCGYDINLDNGVLAGSVFAICFYAIKSRIAPPDICIKLNHIQDDIMVGVLREIESEL